MSLRHDLTQVHAQNARPGEGMAPPENLTHRGWLGGDPADRSPMACRAWIASLPDERRYETRATLVLAFDRILAAGPTLESAADDIDSRAFGPGAVHTLLVDS